MLDNNTWNHLTVDEQIISFKLNYKYLITMLETI